MGRRGLLAAVLSVVLVAMPGSPAVAQLSGEGPPAPRYQVKEDGRLIIGGDVVVSCFQIGREDPYLQAGGPEARACEAAGFGSAADPSSGGVSMPDAPASALPETGGYGIPVSGIIAALIAPALGVIVLMIFGVRRRDL